jgi:hypothetical protein
MQMFQTPAIKPLVPVETAALVSSLWHSNFGFLSDFVLRISDLEHTRFVPASFELSL